MKKKNWFLAGLAVISGILASIFFSKRKKGKKEEKILNNLANEITNIEKKSKIKAEGMAKEIEEIEKIESKRERMRRLKKLWENSN